MDGSDKKRSKKHPHKNTRKTPSKTRSKNSSATRTGNAPRNAAKSTAVKNSPKQNRTKRNDARVHTDTKRTVKSSAAQASPTRHDAIVPITIVGGLVGMLAGTLPASFWVLVFGFSFPPMYLLIPLLIWLSLRLFKGFTGRNGMIATAVFSLFGLYLTLLSTQAADHILRFKMYFYNLPLVTAAMIGRSGTLPGPVLSSACVLPAVFTVIGCFLAYELLKHDDKKRIVAE